MAPGPTLGQCLHGPPTPEHPHGRLRKFDPHQIEHIKAAQRDARARSGGASDRVGYPDKDTRCAPSRLRSR
jgi:cell division control protein 7